MSRSRLSPSLPVLAALCTTALACSDKTQANDSPPADAAPTTLTSFAPEGCSFTAYPMDELPYEQQADVLGTTVNDGKNDYGPSPKHVRVGIGGGVVAGKTGYADPSTSFGVVWQTDVGTRATKLRFAQDSASLAKATAVSGVTYVVQQETSVSGGPEDGVRFHEAYACGLQPGRTYSYQVGGGPAGAEVWSEVHTYTTGPAKGGTDPVLIGFAGDSRDALGRSELPVWKAIGGRMKVAGAHLVTFSGDFVLVGTNQDMWETWGNAADVFASEAFVAMAPGNHENEQLRYFANAMMPTAQGKNPERYGSFDYGPVHVVMYDDYAGIVAPTIDVTGYRAELLAWLDADLAAADANRGNVPFVMTFHHHPFFSSSTNTDRAAELVAMRSSLQATYDKHHVDLDIAGHDHFYERSKAIVGSAEATGGTNYIICAAGGAPAYGTAATPLSAKIEPYDPDKGEGIYGLLTATAKQLKIDIHKMNGSSGSSPADDAVVDQLTLTR
jgi:hypothetical protein